MLIPAPYLSQWDPTAHLSRGDCGIVCAAMVSAWHGVTITPDVLIQRAGLPVGAHSYTFGQIIKAASVVNLKLAYKGGATWEAIRSELALGRPVITLLRYGLISGNQDDFDGSHFWVCLGFDDANVYVNDPDWWSPYRDQGAQRRIPLAEFQTAIGDALIATGNAPYQSLFVES